MHVRSAGELDAAFASLVEQRVSALFVASDPLFVARREQLVALAERHGIPANYDRRELAEARTELSQRKAIERAKGLLMKRHGIDEAEAYNRLRKTAMDKGLKLADLAQRIIDAAELLS